MKNTYDAEPPASAHPSPPTGMLSAGMLSVVIPALNEAARLPATLAALRGVPVTEVVVADGGSTDATPLIAAREGARVVQAPRGRGAQLAAGVAAARGDWLLLWHADTRPGPGWRDAVAEAMAPAPAARGASPGASTGPCAWYFRFALDSANPRARRLERAVALRCALLALPYGDQGLLLRRDLLAASGGVRALPLMEDVDLVARLKRRHGRRCLRKLPADAVTSAARWERGGWRARSLRNLACLGLWYAGVPPRLIARIYA